MSKAYLVSSYASGPRSDQVTQFKSTKKERAKIDSDLTNEKIRHGLERPWGLTREVSPNARVLNFGWHRLKISYKGMHINVTKIVYKKHAKQLVAQS